MFMFTKLIMGILAPISLKTVSKYTNAVKVSIKPSNWRPTVCAIAMETVWQLNVSLQ